MNQLALIAKTQSLIASGDIVGAESALVELADAEGDQALMVVLAQLPPKDILAVIREYDNSRESLINLLVTPEQFARAVVIEKHYKDLTHTHLRGMLNSIIFRDGADPAEFKAYLDQFPTGTFAPLARAHGRVVGAEAGARTCTRRRASARACRRFRAGAGHRRAGSAMTRLFSGVERALRRTALCRLR